MSPDPKPLIEIGELLLDSLEKTASELDRKEAELRSLRGECEHLKQASAQNSITAALRGPSMEKLASRMLQEGLVREGLDLQGAVDELSSNPELLIKIAYTLLKPRTEGAPVRLNKQSFEIEPNVKEFQGRQVVDHDGWLAVLE